MSTKSLHEFKEKMQKKITKKAKRNFYKHLAAYLLKEHSLKPPAIYIALGVSRQRWSQMISIGDGHGVRLVALCKLAIAHDIPMLDLVDLWVDWYLERD